MLQTHYTQLLRDDPALDNALHCHQFIAKVRNNDLPGAILYAQRTLSQEHLHQNVPFYDPSHKVTMVSIQDILGLLCYDHPRQSPLGHLLADSQREMLADQIEKSVQGTCSVLNCLLQQSTQCNRFLEESPQKTHLLTLPF